jgi:hypothetical protein
LFKVSSKDPSSWAQGDGFTDVKLSLHCRSQCKVLSWQAGGDPAIKRNSPSSVFTPFHSTLVLRQISKFDTPTNYVFQEPFLTKF